MGNEQDPLLVRPFVLRDSGSLDDEDSTHTWPAATTPDVRSEPAPDPADAPTAILHLPFRRKHAKVGGAAGEVGGAGRRKQAGGSGNGRRRLIVLAGVATVIVLGAAAAGFAALRSDVRPTVTTGMPGPLPAATAPLPTASTASSIGTGTSATEAGRPAGTTSATTSASSPPSRPSGTPAQPTGSTGAGEPISISPDPTGDVGKTVAPGAPQLVAPEVPPASDRVGVIRGQNSLCLDLNGAVPVDGNHVQVYDCNNSVAQSWTLATDGTLRVQGKCALLVGDNTVQIITCDDRTPAQWRASGQLLINAANNNCLTDPSGGRTSGTGVTVTQCTGSASQRWSLP